MMDQQNFEAARPVSADPAVALAKALGQLPKGRTASQSVDPRPKTSVEALAKELGLKLGDQNELTIRRIKRGKSYSFVRANGTAIRHAGTIRRLHSMAVPPAYREVRYSPDPSSHLQAVGRDAAGRLQYRYHSDWEKVREQRKAHRLARLVGALPKIRRNVSTHLSGDEPTREFALVGGDRADRAHRDPSRQRILCPPQRHPRRHHAAEVQRHARRRLLRADLQGQGRQGRAQGMRRRQAGARHRHPARRARQAHVPVPRRLRHRARGHRPPRSTRSCARSPASRFR